MNKKTKLNIHYEDLMNDIEVLTNKATLGSIFNKKEKIRNLESEIVKLNTIIKELKKQNNILKDEITKNVKQKN